MRRWFVDGELSPASVSNYKTTKLQCLLFSMCLLACVNDQLMAGLGEIIFSPAQVSQVRRNGELLKSCGPM